MHDPNCPVCIECRSLGQRLTEAGVGPIKISHFDVVHDICVAIADKDKLGLIPEKAGIYNVEVWCGDELVRPISRC